MKMKLSKWKRGVAGVLAAVVLISTNSTPAEAKESYEFRTNYDSIDEMTEICWNAYNKGEYGPIIIAKGKLTKNYSTKDVYLVALAGTELVEGQSTGIMEDILVGFQNENNMYTKNVVNAIKKNIPAGSNVMLIGHSLGGMVAQTVAANSEIKEKYNVLYTVTLGSPLIMGGRREGVVKRLGDTSDPVPYLSVTFQIIRQVAGLNREDGGYSKGGWTIKKGCEAHNSSYIREDLWGKYDVTGEKWGNGTLSLDLSSIKYVKAPSWPAQVTY